MWIRLFWVLCLVGSFESLARRQVPLLPPKFHRVAVNTPQPRVMEKVTANRLEEISYPGSGLGIGLDLGTVGRRNETSSDALGFQLLWGGRVTSRLSFMDIFYFKPSVGYFRKSESAGSVSVTQKAFELGVSALWNPFYENKTQLLLGIGQRLELFSSQITVATESNGSPTESRYRLGPQVGLSTLLFDSFILTAELEVGFSLTGNKDTYSGLTLGFLIPIWK